MDGWRVKNGFLYRDEECVGLVASEELAAGVAATMNRLESEGRSMTWTTAHYPASRKLYGRDVSCACGAPWLTVQGVCSQGGDESWVHGASEPPSAHEKAATYGSTCICGAQWNTVARCCTQAPA